MKLGVIYGGKSTESIISVKSAYTFLKWIDYKRYTVIPVYIDNYSKWNFGGGRSKPFENIEEMFLVSDNEERNLESGLESFDIAIPLLSGLHGEDGTIQGIFEMMNIPYTGNGVESSAISMNKIHTKRLLKSYGINFVKDVGLNINQWKSNKCECLDNIQRDLDYPLFIKPARLGSSIGISKASNAIELENAIKIGFQYDLDLLVEEGIEKKEINVAIIQNKESIVISKPGEIITANDFYSYNDKYSEDSAAIKRRAKLKEEQVTLLTKYSEIIFRALNAKGLMRIDYFIDKKGEILLNEVNTMPSLGGSSVFPYLLGISEVSNQEIVDYLIETALYEYERKNILKYDWVLPTKN